MLVALLPGKAEIKYDAAYILAHQIAGKVCDLGFEATVLDEGSSDGVAELFVSVFVYI